MVVYTVHESPKPLTDPLERAARLVFIKDRFHWLAAIFDVVQLLVPAHPLLAIVRIRCRLFELTARVAVAGGTQDATFRCDGNGFKAMPTITQQRPLVVRKEQLGAIAVTADREIKHV